MMKNILTVGVLSFYFLTGASPAADDVKIGVVDFQKIIELSNSCKVAQTEINKQGKQMEADLNDRGVEIEDIKKMITQESLVMSKETREEKQREMRIKIYDFKAIQQKYMEDFKELKNQIISRIQKEIVELIQDIAKKEGYTLIVEKRIAGVVYAPLSADITDAVIQIYNSQSPQSESKKTLNWVNNDLCRLMIQYENASGFCDKNRE
ncbi:MAG: OmpH family outer membrane protein [Deltaproteobacteria bacterium]|nr:OmpH family outer membrane protein [Deltaproteobacteria bacterium]